jgi:hypothetical protein
VPVEQDDVANDEALAIGRFNKEGIGAHEGFVR